MSSKRKQIIKELAILIYAENMLSEAVDDLDFNNLHPKDYKAIEIRGRLRRIMMSYKAYIDFAIQEINKAIRGMAKKDNVNSATFAFALLDLYREYFHDREIPLNMTSSVMDMIDDVVLYVDKDLMRRSFDSAEILIKRVKEQK